MSAVHAREAALAAVLVLGAATPAAAETGKSIDVTAQIVAGCLVAADTGGRWGTIDLGTVAGVAGTGATATLISTAGAGIAVECTPGMSATLAADNGDHPAAGDRFLQRAGSAGTIRYQLFADGASIPWSVPLPLAFVGGRRAIPIRAVATLSGPTAAGTYTDTVRVTLTW
ncbi:spore coat U domain-containing protein [Sphingomonas sp.]|uniref:Csu type fimbrial protein n=1 Tax=Sphingomonas sp. TaxID=28214 RepID=UPI003AFFD776